MNPKPNRKTGRKNQQDAGRRLLMHLAGAQATFAEVAAALHGLSAALGGLMPSLKVLQQTAAPDQLAEVDQAVERIAQVAAAMAGLNSTLAQAEGRIAARVSFEAAATATAVAWAASEVLHRPGAHQ